MSQIQRRGLIDWLESPASPYLAQTRDTSMKGVQNGSRSDDFFQGSEGSFLLQPWPWTWVATGSAFEDKIMTGHLVQFSFEFLKWKSWRNNGMGRGKKKKSFF